MMAYFSISVGGLEDDTCEIDYCPESHRKEPKDEVRHCPEAMLQDADCPQDEAVSDKADDRCCCCCDVVCHNFYFYVDPGAVK